MIGLLILHSPHRFHLAVPSISVVLATRLQSTISHGNIRSLGNAFISFPVSCKKQIMLLVHRLTCTICSVRAHICASLVKTSKQYVLFNIFIRMYCGIFMFFSIHGFSERRPTYLPSAFNLHVLVSFLYCNLLFKIFIIFDISYKFFVFCYVYML